MSAPKSPREAKLVKRVEELEAALDRVLSEANHTLNRDPRKGASYVASLGAIKDYAQAALKRGPYARKRGERGSVYRVEDPGPSSDRKRVTEDEIELFRDGRTVVNGNLVPR